MYRLWDISISPDSREHRLQREAEALRAEIKTEERKKRKAEIVERKVIIRAQYPRNFN